MRYTIGQFAGLHLVSKKTLRYYKEIGLLQPEGIDSLQWLCLLRGQAKVLIITVKREVNAEDETDFK